MSMLRHVSARSRWLLPVVAAATVVALVAAVVVVVSVLRGRNTTLQPPILHLTSVAGGSRSLPSNAAAATSTRGGAPGVTPGGSPSGSGWRLEGTLPDGPSSGRIHVLSAGAATSEFVSTLASSLGMGGQPDHLNGGWYLVSGTTELSVSELAGRQWTYSNHGCIAGPVLDPATGTACAVATSVPPLPVTPNAGAALGSMGVNPPSAAAPPGAVAPPSAIAPPATVAQPVPVPEDVARRLARPVLQAVGVNPDAVRVDTAGGQRNVVFSPQVEGSVVLGLETRVSVDERGQIVDASGWLATPTRGPAYPLISAREAYDQLLQQPQPMMGLAMAPCRIVPGTSGCAPTPDRVVTGATLGLTTAYSTDRGILLVPAWLFQVRGEPSPMAVVAVEQAFLGAPDQPSPGGGPTTGSGTTGSEPGSPATPPATKPAR